MLLTVGDSFTAEPNPTDAANGYVAWPHLLAQRLGMDVENRAVPGAGFINQGIGVWPSRFSRQLLTAQVAAPALVVIFGSVNDRGADGVELRTTAFATLRAARAKFPNAKHLWVGPQWSGLSPRPADVTAARDAVLNAVWAQDWQSWMDPLDQGWFPTSHPEWWGPDGFHPNALGQQHIADLIEPAARQLLGGPS